MMGHAARTWAERAQAELGASRRFRELVARLKRVGAHPLIIRLVERAEHDEEQHAFLCARMARDLGHETGFSKPEGISSAASYSWEALSSERDRVLLDVVSMCCITESFNASLLHTLYSRAAADRTREILHHLLRDEVRHAQIGWAYLGEESKHRDCGFVAGHLHEMLDLSVRDAVFLPLPADASEASFDHGVLPLPLRREHFCNTLDEVIVPGFAHFGIDTSAMTAWRDHKLGLHPKGA